MYIILIQKKNIIKIELETFQTEDNEFVKLIKEKDEIIERLNAENK